jgi:hypothetical protein
MLLRFVMRYAGVANHQKLHTLHGTSYFATVNATEGFADTLLNHEMARICWHSQFCVTNTAPAPTGF